MGDIASASALSGWLLWDRCYHRRQHSTNLEKISGISSSKVSLDCPLLKQQNCGSTSAEWEKADRCATSRHHLWEIMARRGVLSKVLQSLLCAANDVWRTQQCSQRSQISWYSGSIKHVTERSVKIWPLLDKLIIGHWDSESLKSDDVP